MNLNRWLRASWRWFCFGLIGGFICLITLSVWIDRASAELITYQNAAAFNAAIAGRSSSIVDFDSPQIVNPITTLQGLQFGTLPGNVNFIVTDGAPLLGNRLSTVSGTKFLGSDAGELINLSNKTFTITSQSNISALGLYFISESNNLSVDELGIRIGTTSVSIDRNAFTTLSGGIDGYAYFVGIVDTNNQGILSTATVFGSSNASPIGIDNIITAVPEPSSVVFACLAGIGGLSRLAWKRRQAKRNRKRSVTIA